MSDQETTRQVEHLNGGDSRDGLSKLSELARQAFEQHRTTDCLDLTRAILLIEPENIEAQAMRNSMRTALHQDLEKARALFRTTAPAAPPASALPSHLPPLKADISIPAAPDTSAASAPDAESADTDERVEAVPLFRETLAQRHAHSPRRWRPRMLDVATGLVVIALAIAAVPMYRSLSNTPSPSAAESSPGPAPVEPAALNGLELNIPQAAESADVFEAGQEPVLSASLFASQPVDARPSAVTAPTAVADLPPQKNTQPTVSTPSGGTLAVSAPLATEIYLDGRHVGSAPASLALPAGTHTLEYAHGMLRKSVAHVIRPGETTLATVTFDVSVSINAKPWANVFLGGAEKKSLGQTPLGGVQLPVGSVLIFENPEFGPKSYRITGNETGIHIVFP